ncbi:hypothetical protein MMC13_006632 [Lambiella insularis]|nr:hypothetical protein [Lambiella insularis]
MVYPDGWNAASGEDQIDYSDDDLDVVEEDDLFHSRQGAVPDTLEDVEEAPEEEGIDDQEGSLGGKSSLSLKDKAQQAEEDEEEEMLKEILAAKEKGENWFDRHKVSEESRVIEESKVSEKRTTRPFLVDRNARLTSESPEITTTWLEAHRDAMRRLNGEVGGSSQETTTVESTALYMTRNGAQSQPAGDEQEQAMDISDEQSHDEDIDAIGKHLESIEPQVQKAYEDDEAQAARNESSAFVEAVAEKFMAGLQTEDELQEELEGRRQGAEETERLPHEGTQREAGADHDGPAISLENVYLPTGQPTSPFGVPKPATIPALKGGVEWTKKVDHGELAALAKHARAEPVQALHVGFRDTAPKPFPVWRAYQVAVDLEAGSYGPLQASREEDENRFGYHSSEDPKAPNPAADAFIRQEIISRVFPVPAETGEKMQKQSQSKEKGQDIILTRPARKKSNPLKKPITLRKLVGCVRDLYPIRSVTPDGRYDHLTFRLYALNVNEKEDARKKITLVGQISDKHVDMPENVLHYETQIQPLLDGAHENQEFYVIRTFNRLWVQDGRDTSRFFTLDLVIRLPDLIDDEASTSPQEARYFYAQYDTEPTPPGFIQAELDEGIRKLLQTPNEPEVKLANVQVDRHKREWFQWDTKMFPEFFLENFLWKIDDPTINVYPYGWRPTHSFERAEELREKRLKGEPEMEQDDSSQASSPELPAAEEVGQGAYTANSPPPPEAQAQAQQQARLPERHDLEQWREELGVRQQSMNTKMRQLEEREALLNVTLTELQQQRGALTQTLQYLNRQHDSADKTQAALRAATTCDECGEVVTEKSGEHLSRTIQEHFLVRHVLQGDVCKLHPDCRSILGVLDEEARAAHKRMHAQFNVTQPTEVTTGRSTTSQDLRDAEWSDKFTKDLKKNAAGDPRAGGEGSKQTGSSSKAPEKRMAYCNVCYGYLQSLSQEARSKHLTNCNTNEDNLLYYASKKDGTAAKKKWEKPGKPEASTQTEGPKQAEKSTQAEGNGQERETKEANDKKRRRSQDPDRDLYHNSSEELDAEDQPEQSIKDGKKPATKGPKRTKR